jgi:hypothetical protein
MTTNKVLMSVFLLTVVASLAGLPAAAEVLKHEPPMGALTRGQRVLVDDGTCPPGQIKEVVGGDHIKVGGTKQILRVRNCIAKK